MQTTKTKREWFHGLAPILVGCLLLASAGLKADQLLVDEATQDGLLGSPWFLIPLVECELLLGLWLLSGSYTSRCRVVVLTVFSVFAIVALQKGLAGESSCGCFGRLAIHPWWTFGLDILVLAAMWKWSPSQNKQLERNASDKTDDSPRTRNTLGDSLQTLAEVGIVLLVEAPPYRPDAC